MNVKVQGADTPKSRKGGFLARLADALNSKNSANRALTNYPDESAEVLETLRNARNEWINATLNFEYADEEKMIDYYTYKIKAMEVRYEYYLKKAKEMGLKVDMAVIESSESKKVL